ncbi:MAG TPA: hypothetical protein VFJ79_02385 [Acidimicrobiales bacterium]|nr:hypothetical protein [Acidimicrobiales bacterium]
MNLAPTEEEQNAPTPAYRRPGHRRRPVQSDGRLGGAVRRLDNLSITALVNIVVIAILAGALAFTLIHFNEEPSNTSQRISVLNAAATYGAELSTYNYKNLDGPGSPWALVEANATPAFRKDFAKTSGDLTKLLHQYNATAVGHVIDAGLQTLTSSRAVVLLFIDQDVTNTVQKPNKTVQPLRVLITLVRQNGKWLIDNLQVPA